MRLDQGVGGGSRGSMLTGSGKRKARNTCHLKSSGGWGKDLVAPAAGWPATLWHQEARGAGIFHRISRGGHKGEVESRKRR